MKTAALLVFLLAASRVLAADGVDIFRAGLQAYQANGPSALLRTWYSPDDHAKIAGLKKRLAEATAHLGEVVDRRCSPRSHWDAM